MHPQDPDFGTRTWLRKLVPSLYLRTADTLHLACAVQHGFKKIHSNEGHLLDAAKAFGIKAVNVVP